MKILKCYILMQHINPFFLGVGIFTLIFLLAFIFELAQAFVVKGIPLWITLLVLLLYIPTTFGYTIPMGILMASLITWGRLKKDGEITAIKASGINLCPLILLVVSTSLLLSLSLYLFSNLLLPKLNKNHREIWVKALEGAQTLHLDEATFVKIGRFELFVQKVDKKGRLEGVYIYDSGSEASPSQIISAKSGEYQIKTSAGHLYLQLFLVDGVIHQIDRDDPGRYYLLKFQTHTLNIETAIEPIEKQVSEMSSSELKEKIREYQSSGLEVIPLLIELYKRQALPFACLAFTLVGIPFGLSIKRSGSAIGFIFSLLFVFIYYILLIVSQSLAMRGCLPVSLAMWIANLILILTGSILITRILRK